MTGSTYRVTIAFRAPWIMDGPNEGTREAWHLGVSGAVFTSLGEDYVFLSMNEVDGFQCEAEIQAGTEADAVHEVTSILLTALPEVDILEMATREVRPLGYEIEVQFYDTHPGRGEDPLVRHFEMVEGIVDALDVNCRISGDAFAGRYRVARDVPQRSERDAIADTLRPLLTGLKGIELLEVTSRPLI